MDSYKNIFTNAGATGRSGPNKSQVLAEYAGTLLQNKVDMKINGIQEWVVPETGEYIIEAIGAQGGSANTRTGGFGAEMSGTFLLEEGETIQVLVGQAGIGGNNSQSHWSGGGGGGTFVMKGADRATCVPLIIAGGGGGAYQYSSYMKDGINASLTTTGAPGEGNILGGSDGNAGSASNAGFSAGLNQNGPSYGATSFRNGGLGGLMHTSWGDYSLHGGFGGGGGAGLPSGGGGGYSGGGSGTWNTQGAAGGGGSINEGENQINSITSRTGHGIVKIYIPIANPGILLTKINNKWVSLRNSFKNPISIREQKMANYDRGFRPIDIGSILQTNQMIGDSLSGIGTYNTVGQAVFSIGWDYVFAAMHSNQTTGTLIKVDPDTGAPLEVLKTNHPICLALPKENSWNQGHCMHSTTIDGVQYLFIRYDDFNNTTVYRSTWDDNLKQFKNFEAFATMSQNIAGSNYNAMARLNDTTMRIITDNRHVFEFNIRTGEQTNIRMNVGGTWSPSSYPFANTFVPLINPTMIIGASGDGVNFYVQSDSIAPVSFNPNGVNNYASSFNVVGAPQHVHPSTHHNVSYYTPNDGTIKAYKIRYVYIQKRSEI